jgi:hypothetical protein
MNDDELMTAVRESFADIRSNTALERIVSRSRAVRARRRVLGVAAGLGGAAAAAVAVSVALPASPAASHPAASHPVGRSTVQLAAWTVTRQPDGDIQVTFRQATNPAGLQRTLRADGVPASVTFTGHQNPACRPYPLPPSRPDPFAWWLKHHHGMFPGPLSRVLGQPFQNPQSAYNHPQDALVIHPAALPSGAGLQIWTSGTPGAADNFQLEVGLVTASSQCTGS